MTPTQNHTLIGRRAAPPANLAHATPGIIRNVHTLTDYDGEGLLYALIEDADGVLSEHYLPGWVVKPELPTRWQVVTRTDDYAPNSSEIPDGWEVLVEWEPFGVAPYNESCREDPPSHIPAVIWRRKLRQIDGSK